MDTVVSREVFCDIDCGSEQSRSPWSPCTSGKLIRSPLLYMRLGALPLQCAKIALSLPSDLIHIYRIGMVLLGCSDIVGFTTISSSLAAVKVDCFSSNVAQMAPVLDAVSACTFEVVLIFLLPWMEVC